MFDTLTDLFNALEGETYAVLRNFDTLPHSLGGHADIDILCTNPASITAILGEPTRHQVRWNTTVANTIIPFDIRHTGDNYFDPNWQTAVLERRRLRDGVWVLAPDDHQWTLLYHALVHKRRVAADYWPVLRRLPNAPAGQQRSLWLRLLRRYMRRHGYVFTQPSSYDFQHPLMSSLWGRN